MKKLKLIYLLFKIEVSLTQTQLIILFFIIFIFNIGVSIWVVLNEFTNKNNDEKYY